jgi:hypothetical protein
MVEEVKRKYAIPTAPDLFLPPRLGPDLAKNFPPNDDPLKMFDQPPPPILRTSKHERGELSNKQRPVIIDGNIEILAGPLTGNNLGFLNTIIDNNRVIDLRVDFQMGSPRGPPLLRENHFTPFADEFGYGYRPARRIYVRGEIRRIKGPDVLQNSFHVNRIIDLGALTKDEADRVTAEIEKWRQDVAQLAKENQFNEDELRKLAGHSVIKRDGGLFDEEEVETYNRLTEQYWRNHPPSDRAHFGEGYKYERGYEAPKYEARPHPML